MEQWKPVLGYEGLYEASDLGRIKSFWYGKERILKPGKYTGGYLQVILCKNKNKKDYKLHRLVWESFNSKTILPIDHINGIKTDNRLCNLQAITSRENTVKHHLSTNKSSKYIGVSWYKKYYKWSSQIYISGKLKNLGYFTLEIDAHNAYQNALNNYLLIK
jgi:hypothetical protein